MGLSLFVVLVDRVAIFHVQHFPSIHRIFTLFSIPPLPVQVPNNPKFPHFWNFTVRWLRTPYLFCDNFQLFVAMWLSTGGIAGFWLDQIKSARAATLFQGLEAVLTGLGNCKCLTVWSLLSNDYILRYHTTSGRSENGKNSANICKLSFQNRRPCFPRGLPTLHACSVPTCITFRFSAQHINKLLSLHRLRITGPDDVSAHLPRW